MITIEIPGRKKPLEIATVVLDYNGTIACDGGLIFGVESTVRELSKLVPVYVLTADTYGTVRQQCEGLGVEVMTFSCEGAGLCKEKIVKELSERGGVCAIGNGFNDILMFDRAALSVAVLDTEGMCGALLSHADVLVTSPVDAMNLLLKPDRLRATLRN